MHHANIKKSERLRNTLKQLLYVNWGGKGYKGKTTFEIQKKTGSMAVGTDISELRSNGFDIKCKYSHKDTKTGAKIYVYTLQ